MDTMDGMISTIVPRALKGHYCNVCDRAIRQGETYRLWVALFDSCTREPMRWCENCDYDHYPNYTYTY